MKKIIALIGMIILGTSVFAQEVSLVVSGEGATKEAATKAALRSAIEQSFGVFVSANTTILNDDIVRDEVATVASGNIKSYKELSCVRGAGGIYKVSVDAVVSIGKLISYAKSHGSSAEFAGQTFTMEIKMRELNKKNEYEALQNLLVQLKMLQNDIFDFDLNIEDPIQRQDKWDVPITITTKTNQGYVMFDNILTKTLASLSLSAEEQKSYKSNGMTIYPIGIKRNVSDEELVELLNRYDVYDFYNTDRFGLTKKMSMSSADEIINNGSHSEKFDVYYLRNDIAGFIAGVCDILNNAQKACIVGEINRKNEKHAPITAKFQVGIKYLRLTAGSYTTNIHIGDIGGDGAGLPRISNYILAKSKMVFSYTMEDLSNVSGFEVKFPQPKKYEEVGSQTVISEKDRKVFFDEADGLGVPYKVMDDGTIKIPLKKEQEIIIDFNGNKLITPDATCEITRINQYGIYVKEVSGPYLSLWSGYVEVRSNSGKKIRYRY